MGKYTSTEMKRYNYLVSEIEAAYHESSFKLGVSGSVLRILYTICDEGEKCPLSDITRKTGLSKQTVNSAVHKLEKDGIVFLEAADGKSKNVCLTEKGVSFSQKSVAKIMDIENDIFASWNSADVEKYLELTERYLHALKEKINKL